MATRSSLRKHTRLMVAAIREVLAGEGTRCSAAFAGELARLCDPAETVLRGVLQGMLADAAGAVMNHDGAALAAFVRRRGGGVALADELALFVETHTDHAALWQRLWNLADPTRIWRE